ncbi:hypothetical protein [Treponema phagedenis]|uniref:hypothetical protein n=1 Tax=Treponema phagedenis TaxID=162 RepID=UPI001581C35A|nr:hypothetical protein [Treponema phagedenis]QKS91305.1 hypothetical protein HPJ96_01025 [Treponema phagedenis]
MGVALSLSLSLSHVTYPYSKTTHKKNNSVIFCLKNYITTHKFLNLLNFKAAHNGKSLDMLIHAIILMQESFKQHVRRVSHIMQILDNANKTVKDDLAATLSNGDKFYMAAAAHKMNLFKKIKNLKIDLEEI